MICRNGVQKRGHHFAAGVNEAKASHPAGRRFQFCHPFRFTVATMLSMGSGKGIRGQV